MPALDPAALVYFPPRYFPGGYFPPRYFPGVPTGTGGGTFADGSASGTSSAQAVGREVAAATGSAGGTSAASGVAPLATLAVGTADGTSTATAEAFPQNLPAAIVGRFNRTPALDWIEGGLTYGLAQTDADRYAQFRMIGTSWRWTVCDGYVKDVTYRFSCHGVSDHEADRMVRCLVAAYNPRMARLEFQGGTSTLAAPVGGAKDIEEPSAPSGLRLRCRTADFRFTVNRSL